MITDKLYKCIEYSKSIIGNAVTFLMQKEKCPKKLILSSCVGVYVAFSPFIFFHTAMILLFGWLFALNIPVMFAVSWFINNPYTMVPVYALDCLFGDMIFSFLGIDGVLLNPYWMVTVNQFLSTYIGLSGVSFWSFMVGGNLLALIMAGILYPIFSYFFMIIRR